MKGIVEIQQPHIYLPEPCCMCSASATQTELCYLNVLIQLIGTFQYQNKDLILRQNKVILVLE